MSEFGSAVEFSYDASPETVGVKPVSAAAPYRFRLREAKRDGLTQLGDMSLIWLCLALVLRVYAWRAHWTVYDSAAAATASTLFYLVGCARRMYQAPLEPTSKLAILRSLWLSWLYVVAPLLAAGFMTKTSSVYSRVAVLAWFGITPFAMFGFRLMVSAWRRSGRSGPTRVAVVGTGRLGSAVVAQITSGRANGLSLLGVYDDRSSKHSDVSCLVNGSIEDLLAAARSGELDSVYIALPLSAEQRIRALIRALQDSMVSVYLALDGNLRRADGSARLQAIGHVLVSPATLPARPSKPAQDLYESTDIARSGRSVVLPVRARRSKRG